MWRCFWRRRIFRLIYLIILFGIVNIAKDYVLNGGKYQKSKKMQHSLVKKLNDLDQEKQRLHDFLNQIKMVCKVAKRIGEESMTLPVCLETKAGKKLEKNFTLISVESETFLFENEVQSFWKKAKVLTVMSKNDEDLFEKLQNTLKNSSDDDVVIFKLSNYASNYVKPKLIRKLAESHLLDHIQMLYIYLHLKASHTLIFNWYSVLMSLNLNLDFGLYYTSENLKTCLDSLKTSDCTIGTAWLKHSNTEIVIPELSASNSDQSEILFSLLTQSQNCSSLEFFKATADLQNKSPSLTSYIRPKRWPLCLSLVKTPCTVYSAVFDYTEKDFINGLLNLFCTVHIFDPTLRNNISTKNLYFHKWGFAQTKSSIISSVNSQEQKWSFIKASETIHQLGHQNITIDVLHLDLNGGEWEVLQEMISNHALNKINQIIATVHIWYGEEYFNQFEPMNDISNNQQFLKIETTEKCCFTVAWIKSKIELH